MNKNKGFTLIESLIATTIAGTVAVGGIQLVSQKMESDKQEQTAVEIKTILSGVEKRLIIDGYDISKWGATGTNLSWNAGSFENDFLKKELIAKDSSCSHGTWIPSNSSELKSKLIPCTIWNKVPYDMNVRAELRADSTKFIEDFDITMTFKNQDHFEENVKHLIQVTKKAKKHAMNGVGSYNVGFVNRNTKLEITSVQCINLKTDCALLANYNRAGASEYIRSDGKTSMIGSHLTYVDARGASPIKCVRWSKDNLGAWKPDLTEECGVGIYEKTGHPTTIDTITNNGTFKNILLNEECENFVKSGTDVVASGKTPCGMTEDGSEIFQVVDNIEAKTAVILEGSFSVLDAKTLKSDTITAKTIEAVTVFKANTANITNDLTVGGDIRLVGTLRGGSVDVDLVSAPIGNFTNIDQDILGLKNGLSDLDSKVNNEITQRAKSDQNLSSRISRIEKGQTSWQKGVENELRKLSNSNSGSNSLHQAEQLCKNKSPMFMGRDSSRNGRTSCYWNSYQKWTWTGKACQASIIQVDKRCSREHK